MKRGWGLLLVILGAACGAGNADEDTLFLSAAASLREVVAAASGDFQAANPNVSFQFNFAGSGALRQQIEMGSPAEIFLSASPEYVDRLVEAALVAPENRHVFARNSLVVVSNVIRKDAFHSLQDLRREAVIRIAIGDPRSVPAGKYAREWLESEGIWAGIDEKTVLGGDVRQVLSYVQRGEVDVGFVYATDAKLIGLEPLAIVSAAPIPEIVYEAALIGDPGGVVRAFFDYLVSDDVVPTLQAAGFLAP